MKKNFKLVLALVLAAMMIASMIPAMAARVDNAHTITITSHGTGVHDYEAYQVFDGNLDAAEGVLADIEWGDGVNGSALLTALKTTTGEGAIPAALKSGDASLFAACTDAKGVAKVIEANKDSGSFLQAFADVVANSLNTANKLTGSSNGSTPNVATITVPATKGDGYYFIKDATTNLPKGDTASKFMLQVVRDISINAKDTVMTPDKEIVEGTARVKKGSAALGDTVTFEVKIPVPDTTAYKNRFVFQMHDKLPAGLTFMEVSKIEIGELDTTNNKLNTPVIYGNSDISYTVTASSDGETYAAYTAPASTEAAIKAAGGQYIKVVFNNFKALAEADSDTSTDGIQNVIGKYVAVTYTAVVNDDAVFGETGNENEVEFKYSNNPNHDYDGDDFESGDPVGETPKDRTKTYVTTLKVVKVDAASKQTNGDVVTYSTKLAGAKFTLTATDVLNYVEQYGQKFVLASTYNAETDGTRADNNEYYELKDGSYTTTVAGSTDASGRVINDTQYVDKTAKWYKVNYTAVVTKADEGTPETLTAITGDDGVVQFDGLKPGNYTLTEVVAPDGYNVLTAPITLTIGWDRAGYIAALAKLEAERSEEEKALIAAGGFTITAVDQAKGWKMTADGAQYDIVVENNQGSTLPSTGGIGTTIFYIAGSILVLAAAILLITKRRMGNND